MPLNSPSDCGRGRPEEVRDLFSRLANHYDQFNRLASLGMDHRWRKVLLSRLGPGDRVLDVGTGTGRLALGAAGRGAKVVGLDFSLPMVKEAAQKSSGILWLCGEASRLPFGPGKFDVVASAFVLRNLLRAGVLEASFREARRVLRPGGRWLALDLTRPTSKFLGFWHQVFVQRFLGRIGRSVAGSGWPEGYLESTLQELPSEVHWGQWLHSAGFEKVSIRPLWGGLVSLFEAESSPL